MKNFGRAAQYPLPLGTKSPVAYFVLSQRGSVEVRETIRNTWAFGKDDVFFVIGEACTIPLKYRSIDDGGNLACGVSPVQINKRYFEEVQKNILIERAEDEKLLLEQIAFQDILFVNEIDTYRSLSKKLKFIYTCAYQNLPTAKWIVKEAYRKTIRQHRAWGRMQHVIIRMTVMLHHVETLVVPVERTSCVVPRSGNVSPNVDTDRIKLEINLIKSRLISLL